MTISVLPEIDTLEDWPRIRLTVTGTTAAPNAVGSNALVALWRVHQDGARHRVILEDDPRLSGGTFIDWDTAMPFNQPVTYIAASSGYESAPVPITYPSDVSWLIHPTIPEKSVRLGAVKSFGDIKRGTTALLSSPFKPVAGAIRISERARRKPESELVLEVRSEQLAIALDALFDDDPAVLANLAGPDLNTAWRPLNWAWLSPGETNLSDPIQKIDGDLRYFTIPYTVIATPDGIALPTWTCDDVEATFDTCDQVLAAYASCDALTTNTLGTPATGSLLSDPIVPGLFIGVGFVEDPASPGLFYLPA